MLILTARGLLVFGYAVYGITVYLWSRGVGLDQALLVNDVESEFCDGSVRRRWIRLALAIYHQSAGQVVQAR